MERKVLIVVENLPVPFDTRIWQEATTLVRNGYVVSVISPMGKGYEKEFEVFEGVHIYRHPLPKEGNGFLGYFNEYFCALWHEYRLARKVRKEVGFDVIHGANPPDNIFLLSYLFRGVDFIFDHHDICPELYYAKFRKYGILYRIQLLLERLTYRRASIAFVTNESYRKIAMSRGMMKDEDVFVLRSGPRLERMRIQPPNPSLKMGKRYLVAYVGVIGQQEGLDYLVDAAYYIRNTLNRDDIRYVICGGGPYLETLSTRIDKLKLSGIMELTGRIPDDRLMETLNTADICVNPDEFNEMNDKSTMNKVLEYMALAKPMVQFDLTEGRFSADKASLYAKANDAVDLAHKIITLLDDEEMRVFMGQYGYNRILNQLSWEHTHKALLEGYDYYYTKKRIRDAVIHPVHQWRR